MSTTIIDNVKEVMRRASYISNHVDKKHKIGNISKMKEETNHTTRMLKLFDIKDGDKKKIDLGELMERMGAKLCDTIDLVSLETIIESFKEFVTDLEIFDTDPSKDTMTRGDYLYRCFLLLYLRFKSLPLDEKKDERSDAYRDILWFACNHMYANKYKPDHIKEVFRGFINDYVDEIDDYDGNEGDYFTNYTGRDDYSFKVNDYVDDDASLQFDDTDRVEIDQVLSPSKNDSPVRRSSRGNTQKQSMNFTQDKEMIRIKPLEGRPLGIVQAHVAKNVRRDD